MYREKLEKFIKFDLYLFVYKIDAFVEKRDDLIVIVSVSKANYLTLFC